MKIIQNCCKGKLLICENCKSILYLDNEEELIHESVVSIYMIRICPCCAKRNVEVKIIETT